jgi:hypothetical protein
MQKWWLVRLLIIGSVIGGLAVWTNSAAQEAEYNLAHQDIFGSLRRAPVRFSHEVHSETLAEDGCGVCHHVADESSGKPVYAEGEEQGCQGCHARLEDKHKPALREAYHGSCTVCHRRLIKSKGPKHGPSTCGGCHKKQSDENPSK